MSDRDTTDSEAPYRAPKPKTVSQWADGLLYGEKSYEDRKRPEDPRAINPAPPKHSQSQAFSPNKASRVTTSAPPENGQVSLIYLPDQPGLAVTPVAQRGAAISPGFRFTQPNTAYPSTSAAPHGYGTPYDSPGAAGSANRIPKRQLYHSYSNVELMEKREQRARLQRAADTRFTQYGRSPKLLGAQKLSGAFSSGGSGILMGHYSEQKHRRRTHEGARPSTVPNSAPGAGRPLVPTQSTPGKPPRASTGHHASPASRGHYATPRPKTSPTKYDSQYSITGGASTNSVQSNKSASARTASEGLRHQVSEPVLVSPERVKRSKVLHQYGSLSGRSGMNRAPVPSPQASAVTLPASAAAGDEGAAAASAPAAGRPTLSHTLSTKSGTATPARTASAVRGDAGPEATAADAEGALDGDPSTLDQDEDEDDMPDTSAPLLETMPDLPPGNAPTRGITGPMHKASVDSRCRALPAIPVTAANGDCILVPLGGLQQRLWTEKGDRRKPKTWDEMEDTPPSSPGPTTPATPQAAPTAREQDPILGDRVYFRDYERYNSTFQNVSNQQPLTYKALQEALAEAIAYDGSTGDAASVAVLHMLSQPGAIGALGAMMGTLNPSQPDAEPSSRSASGRKANPSRGNSSRAGSRKPSARQGKSVTIKGDSRPGSSRAQEQAPGPAAKARGLLDKGAAKEAVARRKRLTKTWQRAAVDNNDVDPEVRAALQQKMISWLAKKHGTPRTAAARTTHEQMQQLKKKLLKLLDGDVLMWLQEGGSQTLEAQARAVGRELERERDEGRVRSDIAQAAMVANQARHNTQVANEETIKLRLATEMAQVSYTELERVPGNESVKDFYNAREDMRWARPFFVPPKMRATHFQRAAVAEVVVVKEKKRAWHLDFSIFAPRKQESDARDYYDNSRVLKKRLACDWKRTSQKSRFRDLIMKNDEDLRWGGDGLEEELQEVREALARNYDICCRAFSYFCVTGNDIGEAAYSMGLNSFSEFLKDAEIPEKDKNSFVKMSDCDTMFISTNYEDDKTGALAEVNDDRALMRFEFLEIIVRLAVSKYNKSGITNDVSEAVDMLGTRNIKPHLCPEAATDSNDFRRERLYCEEMDLLLESHKPFIMAMYNWAKSKTKSRLLGMEGWVDLLLATKLIGPHTGMSKREAKLVFTWSQMTVVDEIKKRERCISLTFVDFLEALGRTADVLSAPTEEELDDFFHETNPCESKSRVWEYYREVPVQYAEEHRRDSADESAEPTRELHVKCKQLLEIMVYEFMDQFTVKTEEEVTNRLRRQANLK